MLLCGQTCVHWVFGLDSRLRYIDVFVWVAFFDVQG